MKPTRAVLLLIFALVWIAVPCVIGAAPRFGDIPATLGTCAHPPHAS